MNQLQEKKKYLEELEIYIESAKIHLVQIHKDINYHNEMALLFLDRSKIDQKQLLIANERFEETKELVEMIKLEIKNLES